MIQLNQREMEILKLVAQGNSYKQIVDLIDLPLANIKYYIRTAKDKLGAKNNVHAVTLFVQTFSINVPSFSPRP